MSSAKDVATSPRDCHWDVDGLGIAGLAWGPVDGIPVLALHGWMDHAASFQELAPKLTGCHVVALDLTGHGLSDNRSADATYNIWDDLPQINEVLNRLGWDRCVLLGHSRGAIIATLFAATLPEKVQAVIALDSILSEPTEPDAFVETLRAFIHQTRKKKSRPERMFETRAAYVERRCAQGNSLLAAEALAERATEQVAGGFRMRGDPRLFASSAVRLNPPHLDAILRAVQCPVLNVWAKDSTDSTPEKVQALIEQCRNLVGNYEALYLPGDHHFHLDPNVAEDLSRAILRFLDKHRV